MCKELGRLAQGYGETEGTNTVFFMTHEEIKRIPKDRTVTYTRIVVDYRPQKDDPNRVRITVGGNLIEYPGELTTRTADLITSKILWNRVLSTPGASIIFERKTSKNNAAHLGRTGALSTAHPHSHQQLHSGGNCE